MGITSTLKNHTTTCTDPRWLDRQLAHASWVVLIGTPFLFPFLFPVLVVSSGIVAFVSTYPPARRRAKIVFGVHSAILALIVVLVIRAFRP